MSTDLVLFIFVILAALFVFRKRAFAFLLYAFSVIAITIFLIVLMAYKNGIYFLELLVFYF